MADSTWPSTVPDRFQSSGYSYETDSGLLRTSMDSGPAKVRRRFTAVPERHSGTIVMTKTQFATWQSWFVNTIMQGALTFTMTNPLDTTGTITARIAASSGAPYKFSPESGTEYGVLSLTVEVLP